MINNFEKQMLEKSLQFLNINNTEPITLSKLQEIINHVSEEYNSLDDIKFKYVIENPEGQEKMICGITDYDYIDELNIICFKTDRKKNSYKVISKDPSILEIKANNVFSLSDLQNIIDDCKELENWGYIMICIENLFYPNMYLINNDSVLIKIGENINES